MRILAASVGSYGHTYPLLPLTVAARDAGHDISYATSPSFHPLLRGFGFEPLTVGADIGEAFRELFAELGMTGRRPRGSLPQDQMTEYAGRVFGGILPRRAVAGLVPLIGEHRPDLVIYEAAYRGAGVAARITGVPALCHGVGRVDDGGAEIFAGDRLAALAAEHGVDLGPGGLDDPYLDICPASLQPASFLAGATVRVPLRPVAFSQAGDLPGWVREPGPPLVYVTMGTAFADPEVMARVVAGLGRVDARVLVTGGRLVDPGAIGEPPANVHVEPWVAQADLLPLADLVVHHGGAGTTLGCLAAGVPQLVVPQAADQFGNAAAVTSAGAAAQLLPPELSADAMAATATRLLSDGGVRAAAAAFAAEIAQMPSPEEVASTLPGYAGS